MEGILQSYTFLLNIISSSCVIAVVANLCQHIQPHSFEDVNKQITISLFLFCLIITQSVRARVCVKYRVTHNKLLTTIRRFEDDSQFHHDLWIDVFVVGSSVFINLNFQRFQYNNVCIYKTYWSGEFRIVKLNIQELKRNNNLNWEFYC